MANVDFPRGFVPLYHLTGGEIRTKDRVLTTGQTVYAGDLLKAVAGGTVQAAGAGDGVIVIGVAAGYVDDSASAGGKTVPVYQDPKIVFSVQADTGTAPASIDIFATADHVAGAGNATTGISGHELDASNIGTGAQLKILDRINRGDNAWGEHVDLEVVINEHILSAAVAGV